ncbi:MAG TPA: AAA family ATPase [Arcobacter sp.]|nr:AAA family ATPase [Arcobacter sp.]
MELNIGEKCLLELKKEVTENEYNKYLKNLLYDEKNSNEHQVYFSVDNLHIAKWIQSRYTPKITHFFESNRGVKPKVTIKVRKKETISKKNVPKSSEIANKFEYAALNPLLTFDTFVVGESNQFAYTVAKSVSENPSIQYNPLYIYGDVGLGKTHLLQAIGNYGLSCGKKVIYTTLEEFTNIFIAHIRTHTMDTFRDTFRLCDMLLIDDIQFLKGKEKTQDEFFHTFNKLHAGIKGVSYHLKNPFKT